jgi:hypothetical protein
MGLWWWGGREEDDDGVRGEFESLEGLCRTTGRGGAVAGLAW